MITKTRLHHSLSLLLRLLVLFSISLPPLFAAPSSFTPTTVYIDDEDWGIPTAGYDPETSASIKKFVLPFYGIETVTQTGGETNPGESHGCPHVTYEHYNCAALDFGLATGTPVHAIYPGTVIYSGNAGEGFGNRVVIEHDGLGLYSLYAHLSTIDSAIQPGYRVQRETHLGLSGNSGTIDPHLHFGITRIDGDGNVFVPIELYSYPGITWHNPENPDSCIVDDCGRASYAPSCTPSQGSSIAASNDCPIAPNPSYDQARFVRDVTIPDGMVVVPGQMLEKVWTTENTGTTTWGSGYHLAFIEGSRLGAPPTISLPTVAPGTRANLTLPLHLPDTLSPGEYTGYWRLRNAQGTYFGDRLWIRIRIGNTQPPGGNGAAVELVEITDVPAFIRPGESFQPRVTFQVNQGQLRQDRGDMLRFVGGTNVANFPHVAVRGTIHSGQRVTFHFTAGATMIAPQSDGDYETRWRVWANGGWVGDDIVLRFTVTQFPHGHPPHAPVLTSPHDWAVSVGSPPTLCAEEQGDPDGDAITHYRFKIVESANLWDSGWSESSCATPQGIGNYGYQWYAQVRDSRGLESPPSERRHFTLESSSVTIKDVSFQPASPSRSEEVTIFAATQGCGGVNVGLRVSVNTAPDGSATGEWKVIKELGVPVFTDNDAPRWDTREYEAGTHKVRVEAISCDGTIASQDHQYTLLPGVPSHPYLQSPSDGVWTTSRNLTFSWNAAQRATSYTLLIGTSPNVTDNLLVEETVTTTSFSTTFDQAHSILYWKVLAHNSYGSTTSGPWQFGIEHDAPRVTFNHEVTPDTLWDIQVPLSWHGMDAHSGIHTYDIQVRRDHDGSWDDWLQQVPYTAAIFTGQLGHQYAFRIRARDIAGNVSPYPIEPSLIVTLDATTRPPQSWDASGYHTRVPLTVVNRNDTTTLPIGYPIHIHFDASTTPTAAEIYAASTAAEKGADIRIWYQTQEISRYIATFTPSGIDIWFPNQFPLPGGGVAPAATYALYATNAQAQPPQNERETIFIPRNDTTTALLMYFDDSQGTQVTDYSRYHTHGRIDGTVTWGEGRFQGGLSFDGTTSINVGNPDHLQFRHALTVEAWIRPSQIDEHTRNIISKVTSTSQGPDHSWRLYTRSNGTLVFHVVSGPTEKSVAVENHLHPHQWYHIAGVYDQQNIRLYINGVEVGSTPYDQPIHLSSAPVIIGNTTYGNEPFLGDIDGVRLSNNAHTDFSYGAIVFDPQSITGTAQSVEERGKAQLRIVNIDTASTMDGGLLVRTVVQNTGRSSTLNTIRTDIYAVDAYDNSLTFDRSIGNWVTDPIEPGESVTLTKVLHTTDIVPSFQYRTPHHDYPLMLIVQTDSFSMLDGEVTTHPYSIPPEDSCLAYPDRDEPNNSHGHARSMSIGLPTTRTFDRINDQDWIAFYAIQGHSYTIQTYDLAAQTDTIITLYDRDGTTLLTHNDDFNSLGSHITWEAPTTGRYYFNVRQWNPAVAGCHTQYTLMITGTTHLFLPNLFYPVGDPPRFGVMSR